MNNRIAYRAQEVAELLGVTVGTVRRWCDDGTVPAQKIGGTWFVPAAAVDQLRGEVSA